MLSLKGVYQVAETNLFSKLPSSKSSLPKNKSNDGRNGYTNPSNEMSNVRTSLEYSNRITTNYQPNLYNNHSQQPERTVTRTNRTQNESTQNINHMEMEKIKENNFLEIKSIIFVFDEIVQNAIYLTDLKSNSI